MTTDSTNTRREDTANNETDISDLEAKLRDLADMLRPCSVNMLTAAGMHNGDVLLVFETNYDASKLLSAMAFFDPAGRNQEIIESVINGTGAWRCVPMPVLAIDAPGYFDLNPPLPPLLVHIGVRFPCDQVDYVLQAVRTAVERCNEGDRP